MANPIFGYTSPFSSFVDPKRNQLMGMAAGLAGGGLGGMWQGGMQGSGLDMRAQEQQFEQDQRNQTAEWLKANYPQYAGLPPAEGFRAAMAEMGRTQGGGNLTAEQRNWQFGQENPEFMDFLGGSNRQNISLTPQWAQDEQGNWRMLQTSSTGELIQSQIPEGLQLADPRLMAAERSAGTQFGGDVAGAQFALPQAQLTRDQTLSAIEDIRGQTAGMEEHFGKFFGVPQQMTPALPGSQKANFQVTVERAVNRAFLEARQMLKGGGQITDFESRKAEAAITSMQLALEKGDRALFEKSVADFEQAVKDGYTKMEQQASMLPGIARQPVMAPGTQPGNGTTSTGLPWSIVP